MQKMEEFHLHLLEWTWVTEVVISIFLQRGLSTHLFVYLFSLIIHKKLPHLPHRHALRVGSDSIVML